MKLRELLSVMSDKMTIQILPSWEAPEGMQVWEHFEWVRKDIIYEGLFTDLPASLLEKDDLCLREVFKFSAYEAGFVKIWLK